MRRQLLKLILLIKIKLNQKNHLKMMQLPQINQKQMRVMQVHQLQTSRLQIKEINQLTLQNQMQVLQEIQQAKMHNQRVLQVVLLQEPHPVEQLQEQEWELEQELCQEQVGVCQEWLVLLVQWVAAWAAE
jgi:hypothetical protein